MKTTASLLGLSLLLQATTAWGGAAPTWYTEHLQRLVADGGLWVTDNGNYLSEQEPYTAYALHWQSGVGDHTAVGRLYGIRDGQEGATIWQFRLYWHPGQDQALLQQFGAGGALLSGPLTLEEDGRERLLQTFWAPDGRSWEVGHLTEWTSPDEHIGSSYQVDEAGQWTEQRRYVWVRQKR